MGLFQFGRKLESVKEYSLQEIPVFSSLSPSEQKLVEKKARLVEYKRGDIVYDEGTPSEAFYVVISGRFRLFTKSKNGINGDTLLYFYRGDHFGETSLLTGRAHSATVEAKRDGLILRLEKADFFELIQDIPAISLHLSRSLGHRLTQNIDIGHRREVKIAALYSKISPAYSLTFCADLASAIFQQTGQKTIVVDFEPQVHPIFQDIFHRAEGPSLNLASIDPTKESDLKANIIHHENGFDYLHAPGSEAIEKDEKKIATFLTFLTYRYNYVLLRLPQEISHLTLKVLKHTDMVYVYMEEESLGSAFLTDLMKDLQVNYGFGTADIKVVLHQSGDKPRMSLLHSDQFVEYQHYVHLPEKGKFAERYDAYLKYLAKELSGMLVGLALGSGAAFGLAHIGVMKALEKEGIPIDVISGSSIGAFVGGFWAAGVSADEMAHIARSIDKRTGFFKLLGFRDLSVAHLGFFKGHQVARFMQSHMGDKHFHELKIPLKVIATDLFSAEEVILETGRVVDAIRASISIPGIFRPVHHQGRQLIDGGVVDPLPVRVLTKLGVRKIIAVNVLSGPHDWVERNKLRESSRKDWLEMMQRKNIGNKLVAQFLDRAQDRYAINIFNVIMNTIQFMEYEIAQSWGTQADILITPIVKDAHWAEFYSPDKFIKMGEQRTLEQLDEIKRLIAE